ncbi:hypothetical protein [Amycolatopsis sp. lyj-112]|uniref:hypothetical protein n=1 Tax=Amycolatopsis sp. lyj-112 TaxID=2789288 RepID=UPI0039795339
MKRAQIGRVGVIFAGVLALVGLTIGPAQAEHSFTFTQANTKFDATDTHGRFTGQAKTIPGQAVPMTWSFRVAPAVQAIATSSMNCTAGHMQLSYHDAHSNIPVDYFWHSTVQGNRSNNTKYDLYGSCTFSVKGNGKANLKFVFHYSMFCGPCGNVAARTIANGFSTTLDVTPAGR